MQGVFVGQLPRRVNSKKSSWLKKDNKYAHNNPANWIGK